MKNKNLSLIIVSLVFGFFFFVETQVCYAQSFLDSARSVLDKVEGAKRFVNQIDVNELSELPLAIRSDVGIDGNSKLVLAVGQVNFMPDFAEVTLFARLRIPQNNQILEFGARGIKLSYSGGILGDGRLALLRDITIPMGGMSVTLKGSGLHTPYDLTYVDVDCNGFRELGLSAEITLPQTFFPLDVNGKKLTGSVSAYFSTVVRDWNDILVEISLPDFGVKGLDDFGFRLKNAIVDMSDRRNSPYMVFPQSYMSNAFGGEDLALWRGLYVEQLYVTLPPQFKDRGSQQRIGFEASHMLIDGNGLSGSFYADNILSIDRGTASGWRFSVNSFRLDIEANRIKGAGFDGQIGLPSSQGQLLNYSAFIAANNEYLLRVASTDEISFDIWKAKLIIDESSYAELKVSGGEFLPSVLLNGRMSILSGEGQQVAHVEDIVFQELKLQTEQPYISVRHMGYKGKASIKGFPISISSIDVVSSADIFSLVFGVELELSKSQIIAQTQLRVNGKVGKDQGLLKMDFEKVDLSGIRINANIANQLKLSGGIEMYDRHPIYGDGFGGDLKMGITSLRASVDAKIHFGKKEFSYWYVDAKVDLGLGIPIGPLMLRGFSGGAYNRMVMDSDQRGSINYNPSEMRYVPDENAGFGIRLGVLMHVARPEVVDIEASFETSFNRHGGVNYIGIYGSASVMGKIPGVDKIGSFLDDKIAAVSQKAKELGINDERVRTVFDEKATAEPTATAKLLASGPQVQQPGKPGLIAQLGILFDFANNTFQSNFDLHINFLGGVISGIGPEYRAGYSVARFSPGEWYVLAGTPEDPMGVQFGIGSFRIKTQSYFMMGSKIPGSPPPPRQVADILGKDVAQLDYMRDLNALNTGGGFAFGSQLSLSTGEFRFLILYASLEAGLGFDIMLKNYGIMAHCEGNNEPIGINGWYANGQSYAYLQGEVGLRVKLFRRVRRFSILKAGTAVLMQAKLPNPAWFKGHMAVKYSVLGGLVKGRINMAVTIGKECKIVGAALDEELPIISSISPDDKAKDVDVFAAPQAAFNMPIDQEITTEEEGGPQTFRIKLEEFKLTHQGQVIDGAMRWNESKNLVSFYSKEILPPHSDITATVRVAMQQLNGGSWQTQYENGTKIEETKTITFKTGDAPYYVPLHNIEYMYPVKDQQSYYIGESKSGFVQLKRGQQYLFTDPQSIALVVADKGQEKEVAVKYDISKSRLSFNMPEMRASQSYKALLVNKNPDPEKISSSSAEYVSKTDEQGNQMQVSNRQAQSATRNDLRHTYLEYDFKSSQYNTLSKKLDAIPGKKPSFGIMGIDIIDLHVKTDAYESFESVELIGSEFTGGQALIQVEAKPAGEKYYENVIYPLLYKNYPIDSYVTITHRDVSELGIIPVKGIRVDNTVLSDIVAGKSSGYHTGYLPWVYNLFFYYKQDFLDVQNKAVNRYLGQPEGSRFKHLIEGTFTYPFQGKYRTQYRYVLPDGTVGTTKDISYENEVRSPIKN
ncbi:hypothetical protein [Sphingobacterium luzhongxinii]|uniref:hypothetical protein n=1 Tax=Sphingobacterium luzhongxinii TaxID=2654181 RepID=UPI0013DB2D67|nr:hypothetical protein [Sphingobacterium sp. xlx-73]